MAGTQSITTYSLPHMGEQLIDLCDEHAGAGAREARREVDLGYGTLGAVSRGEHRGYCLVCEEQRGWVADRAPSSGEPVARGCRRADLEDGERLHQTREAAVREAARIWRCERVESAIAAAREHDAAGTREVRS